MLNPLDTDYQSHLASLFLANLFLLEVMSPIGRSNSIATLRDALRIYSRVGIRGTSDFRAPNAWQ
jgi:hypothetical protein